MRLVLFVDDEPQILDGFRRGLLRYTSDFGMVFANSVAEALEILSTDEIDVVVTDVRMPGSSGFDLLGYIRASPKYQAVPVIIVTGVNDGEMKAEALERGATDLIGKPVKTIDLVARLRNALQLKEYHDALQQRSAALEEEVRRRTRQLDASRAEVVLRLGRAAEYRDEATGLHVARVGCYCRILAEQLGLERTFCETIFLSGPLHDVGKIGIPDQILLKPGRLDPDERAIMERHSEIGATILGQSPGGFDQLLAGFDSSLGGEFERLDNPLLQMAATIAGYHHEKWDGTGYPHGTAGEAIPLEARICAISDVYDALSSPRPYKPAFEESKVLAILAEGDGTHFDPQVYRAFLASLDRIRAVRSELGDPSPVAVGGPVP